MSRARFLIYAEGGSKTFLGHIMRTLTLADAMSCHDIEVCFATSSDDGKDLIARRGFPVFMMNDLNLNELIAITGDYGISGILVDRFGLTIEQHRLLADSVGYLVHIDDFCYDGPAQLIINATIDHRPSGRTGRWLCGGKYALIRPQFIDHHKTIVDLPKDILLTTGFGDPGNVHLKMIDLLRSALPEVNTHVVVGGGYSTKEILHEWASNDARLYLYENNTDLSGVMKKADLAVSAAGTTLYELAASGTPTIAFSLYDNQIDNIDRVARKGCVIPIGWYEAIEYGRLENTLIDLFNDKEKRRRMSACGTDWIDGKGADRIAQVIAEEIPR